jgi:hypothetical protein
VEVGWHMIIVVHRDRDFEELADAGQSRWRARATAGGVATFAATAGRGYGSIGRVSRHKGPELPRKDQILLEHARVTLG